MTQLLGKVKIYLPKAVLHITPALPLKKRVKGVTHTKTIGGKRIRTNVTCQLGDAQKNDDKIIYPVVLPKDVEDLLKRAKGYRGEERFAIEPFLYATMAGGVEPEYQASGELSGRTYPGYGRIITNLEGGQLKAFVMETDQWMTERAKFHYPQLAVVNSKIDRYRQVAYLTISQHRVYSTKEAGEALWWHEVQIIYQQTVNYKKEFYEDELMEALESKKLGGFWEAALLAIELGIPKIQKHISAWLKGMTDEEKSLAPLFCTPHRLATAEVEEKEVEAPEPAPPPVEESQKKLKEKVKEKKAK